MYLEHWGLQKSPFENVPSRDVFYRSPQHEEALRRLLYSIEHRKGVAMLTGEVGCGKTTVNKAINYHLGRDQFQFEMSSPEEASVKITGSVFSMGSAGSQLKSASGFGNTVAE